MNIKYYPELRELEEHNNYLPSISIILPLRMHSEPEFRKYVKIKVDTLERKLYESYPDEMVRLMVLKLNGLLNDLQLDKSKEGLIIYLSPWFYKVYYLDFKPEEQIVIDSSFEIRDLIYNHDLVNTAVLVLLSANEISYMVYEKYKLAKIHVDVPLHIEDNFKHDDSIFYEKSDQKEKAIKAIVKNSDRGLSMLLKAHAYPVVVAGSDKLLSEFRKVTRNENAIAEYVSGNYLESSTEELIHLIMQSLKKLNEHKQTLIIDKLSRLDIQGGLAIGVQEIWKQVVQKNVDTLVVEKNFRKLAGLGVGREEIFTDDLENIPYPMQDVVDDIIEKVMLCGGKVQFVEDGTLREWMHIVLIKNHSL
ncbi:MAG: hypothetical protein ABI761_04375 [Saprospiraceae bacterium]